MVGLYSEIVIVPKVLSLKVELRAVAELLLSMVLEVPPWSQIRPPIMLPTEANPVALQVIYLAAPRVCGQL